VKDKGKSRYSGDPENDARKTKEDTKDALGKLEVKELSDLEKECARARSILNANIGACHVKLVRYLSHPLALAYYLTQNEYKEAAEACTRGKRGVTRSKLHALTFIHSIRR
jgi:hypothetical protein